MKVYSFDVFDTCITRSYITPTSLFYELAENVLEDYRASAFVGWTVEKFVRCRINAERNARKLAISAEDISLENIWDEFVSKQKLMIDKNLLIEREMVIEERNLLPVSKMLDYIANIRGGGGKVVFISDMYLPVSFLKKVLIKFNIAKACDSFYVSGDVGLLKSTSNLYKHVLEQERIKPQDLCHIGDNLRSDFITPRKMGINAVRFVDVQLSRFESIFTKKCDMTHWDRNRMCGELRALRLSNSKGSPLPCDAKSSLFSGVVAPFLVAFVSWVVHSARVNGIKRLYFVSRDGEVMFEIAKKLFSDEGIDFRYLHGSRQAWRKCSVSDISRQQLQWLIVPHETASLKGILEKLGVTPEDLRGELQAYGFDVRRCNDQLSIEEMPAVWSLLESSEVRFVILRKVKDARELAYKYFQEQGLLDEVKWSLVDTGWRLTCQQSLKYILDKGSVKSNDIHGFYMGVRRDRVTDGVGRYSAFFDFYVKRDRWLFQQGVASVIEEVMTMPSHATVTSYEQSAGKVIPVFGSLDREREVAELFMYKQSVVFRYCELVVISKSHLLPEFRGAACQSLKRFFQSPLASEMEVISFVPVNVGQSHHHKESRRLASPLTLRDLFKMAVYVLTGKQGAFTDLTHAWYLGSAALSSFQARTLFRVFYITKIAYDEIMLGIDSVIRKDKS